MMTDDQILAVVSAHKEGKKIECKMPSGEKWWPMDGATRWDFSNYEYRVAPEPRNPREWVTGVTKWGDLTRDVSQSAYSIRVREVLE